MTSSVPIGTQRRATFTGVFVLLAAVTMLFAAFTSAMVVRRGLAGDWVSMRVPPILWANTAVLAASSAAVELSRRALRRGGRGGFNLWWSLATGLGLLFLAGQYMAWRELHAAGIYLATNPASSFFYLLTVTHAVHLAGGLAALGYIEWKALRLELGPGKRTAVDVSALYWHFLDGLWIYLLLLFQLWG